MPTETLHSVTHDPTGFIDCDFLKGVVGAIRNKLDNSESSVLAAALHRFVYTRAEYGDDLGAGLNRSPRETLKKNGRCADRSLLLTALYREAGLDSRITSVAEIDGSGYHGFVEIGFSTDSRRIIEQLDQFYRDYDVISSGEYHFFEMDDMHYFVADPVSSRYVGDISGLEKMGYLGKDGRLNVERRFTLKY